MGELEVDASPTLWSLFVQAADEGAAISEPMREPPRRSSLVEILEQAEGVAASIVSSCGPVQRVGILIPNSSEWFVAFFAALRVGAAVVTLPLPTTTSSAYRRHLSGILNDSKLDVIVLTETMPRIVREVARSPGPVHEIGDTPPPRVHLSSATEPAQSSDALAVVQYTSGSMDVPKGVGLAHNNVVTGLAATASACRWAAGDSIGVWVPLFHDMGLFTALSGLVRGATCQLWQPRQFVRDTASWLASFAASGATVMASPNFAYDRIAAAAGGQKLDLSRWRVALNGSEPVRRKTLEAFHAALVPHGVSEAMMTLGLRLRGSYALGCLRIA